MSEQRLVCDRCHNEDVTHHITTDILDAHVGPNCAREAEKMNSHLYFKIEKLKERKQKHED